MSFSSLPRLAFAAFVFLSVARLSDGTAATRALVGAQAREARRARTALRLHSSWGIGYPLPLGHVFPFPPPAPVWRSMVVASGMSFLEKASGVELDPPPAAGTPGFAKIGKEFKVPWWCAPFMPPDAGGKGPPMEDGLWISHGCVNCPRTQVVGNMPRNPVMDLGAPTVASTPVDGPNGPGTGQRAIEPEWGRSAAAYFNRR